MRGYNFVHGTIGRMEQKPDESPNRESPLFVAFPGCAVVFAVVAVLLLLLFMYGLANLPNS
jgi:hypothetical protein